MTRRYHSSETSLGGIARITHAKLPHRGDKAIRIIANNTINSFIMLCSNGGCNALFFLQVFPQQRSIWRK